MEQLLAHLVGDYVLQTSHMAEHKVRSWPITLWHGNPLHSYHPPEVELSSKH